MPKWLQLMLCLLLLLLDLTKTWTWSMGASTHLELWHSILKMTWYGTFWHRFQNLYFLIWIQLIWVIKFYVFVRLLTKYVFKWMLFLKMDHMKLLLLWSVHWWWQCLIRQIDFEIISWTLFSWEITVASHIQNIIFLGTHFICFICSSYWILAVFSLTWYTSFDKDFPTYKHALSYKWCEASSWKS